jgi:hypothetical protein
VRRNMIVVNIMSLRALIFRDRCLLVLADGVDHDLVELMMRHMERPTEVTLVWRGGLMCQ